MATAFVEVFGEADPAALEAEAIETLEVAIEGWEGAPGSPEVWLTKAFARIAATVFDLASIVSREAFKTFGETIVGVPPILAAPATATSTWKVTDALGHKIPDGTLVSIAVSGDETQAFRTVGDVVIPPESDESEAGEVLLEAVNAGEAASGLTATPVLLSSLSFVNPGGITLTGATSGGVDAEDEDTYLSRLTEELQTLTLSAVIPRDYEILARRVAGVARATALDNYDADAEESEVPLVVTVAVVDADGEALSEGVKEGVQELLEGRSLSNVKTFVIDPSYTVVDVKAEVVVLPGYDQSTVLAAVEERLSTYLNPAHWGLPFGISDTGSSAGWVNETTLYRNELLSEIDRVAGVARVVDVELAEGEGELGTEDLVIEGPAALTQPGSLEVLAA
jgi:Baseplate J-like protein